MTDSQTLVRYFQRFDELAEAGREFLEKKGSLFGQLIDRAVSCLKNNGQILVFGNGGSAAQAQHFSAEMVNRFIKMRKAYRAVALTTDTSTLTSIGNDLSFDRIFSRQVEALGRPGDMAIGLSTSGNSPNIIEALIAAREKGLVTAALTGEGGGKLGPLADFLMEVPSRHTPLIQEIHLVLLHLLALEIEERLG